MNFPYEKYPPASAQQYFLTTQVPTHVQYNNYPFHTLEYCLPPMYGDVQMNNSIALGPLCFQTPGSEQLLSPFSPLNLYQRHSNYNNGKQNYEDFMVLSNYAQSTAPPILGHNTCPSFSSHGELSASSNARSIIGKHDVVGGSTVNSSCPTTVKSIKNISFGTNIPINACANAVSKAKPPLLVGALTAQKNVKRSDVPKKDKIFIKEQDCIEEITDHLNQHLRLNDPIIVSPSFNQQAEITTPKYSKKRPKTNSAQSTFNVNVIIPKLEHKETVKPEPQSSREPAAISCEVHSKTATLPKPKPSEVRVLKRTEALPTGPDSHITFDTISSMPSRQKRALQTKTNRRQMLSRYRNLLAQSAPTPRRGVERLIPKEKSLSRLKTGIVRDRLIRHPLAQPDHSYETQTDAINAPHKIEKIVLPILPDLEEPIIELLKLLVEFHDRSFKQTVDAPEKRKNTRRIVCGFHETIKNLKLNKLKFLIVARDLEKGAYEIEEEQETEETVDSPKRSNALAKTLKQTVDMARERDCPVVQAFNRRRLQRLCHKGGPVSCVGVINFAGAEVIAMKLIESFRNAVS